MIILWDSSGEPRWPAGLINRPVRFDSGPASKFGGEQRRSTRAGLSSAGGPERATTDSFAELAQQVDAAGLNPARYRFESGARHQFARAVKGHWPAGPFSGRQLTNFALLPASGFPERARAIQLVRTGDKPPAQYQVAPGNDVLVVLSRAGWPPVSMAASMVAPEEAMPHHPLARAPPLVHNGCGLGCKAGRARNRWPTKRTELAGGRRAPEARQPTPSHGHGHN